MSRGKDFLERCYALTDSEAVKSFYDAQAREYDEILLEDIGYVAPRVSADLFARHCEDRSARIIDLGCGTGLMGAALRELGYLHIDGADVSESMLQVAREKRIYDELLTVDLHQSLTIATGAYDAVVSVGVFGGHVPAGAMDEAVRLAKSGGVVCITLNELALREHGYGEKLRAMEDTGAVHMIQMTEEDYHLKENIRGWVCLMRAP